MAKAMLHSLDRDGTHQANLVEVEILEEVGNNDYIVLTPDGIKCHALFIPSPATVLPTICTVSQTTEFNRRK